MVEVGLILDTVVCGALLALLWDRLRSKEGLDARIDDLTEGLAMMATELLNRTEELLKIKDFMPEISLVNQNPLASLAEFIKALRGGDIFPTDNITDPTRSGDGRYAAEIEQYATTKEETTQTSETQDFID
jgi:hypothetical protein